MDLDIFYEFNRKSFILVKKLVAEVFPKHEDLYALKKMLFIKSEMGIVNINFKIIEI